MNGETKSRSSLRSLLQPAARLVRPARRVAARRRFLRDMRRRFATSPPATLNEKILYKMAFDRRPILTTLADKVAVREYVADRVGREVLTETYGILGSPGELRLDELPERFVIKPTHGSCAVIIVDDRAPEDATLLAPAHRSEWRCGMSRVRKKALDSGAFESLAESWLSNRYSSVREWAYRDIPPRLLVEELLEGPDGHVPPDYKFWCFEGQVGVVGIEIGRFRRHTKSIHLPDWTPLEVTHSPQPKEAPSVPPNLHQMLDVATKLATGIDFIRVDLYASQRGTLFGEMTNYPGGGNSWLAAEPVVQGLHSAWRPERHYGPA